MRKAKFHVRAPMVYASQFQEGTVTIDRGSNLVEVRPKHAHRTYTMLLDDLASIVVRRTLSLELKEKKKQKLMRRKGLL